MNKIETSFKQLPFSPRWLEKNNLIPKSKIHRIIEFFISKKILTKYPILVEVLKKPVAQEEHTIILDENGKRIVTTKE